jgi:hypothetical protein
MRRIWLAAFAAPVVAALIAGYAEGIGGGVRAAAACANWKRVSSQTPVGGPAHRILGMDMTSARNGWAVGYSGGADVGTETAFILRWDGAAWKLQNAPRRSASHHYLEDVSAVSSSAAWAVGYYARGSTFRTLILRWDGTRWKTQPSPNVGAGDNLLLDVVATSPTNAWAVGTYRTASGAYRTLILRWNGAAWKRQPAPSREASDVSLTGVAATSPNNAWAVGSYEDNETFDTGSFILHWDGQAWSPQPVPDIASDNFLNDVTATSLGNAWAVGALRQVGTERPHILRWDGKGWKVQRVAGIGEAGLRGVTAASGKKAWAVGGKGIDDVPLVLYWDGTSWRQRPVAAPDGRLTAVAAAAGLAWAGGTDAENDSGTVIVRGC